MAFHEKAIYDWIFRFDWIIAVKSGLIEKPLLVTLTLAYISGCSWFGSNDQSNADISINAADQAKRFCYGTKDKRWECSEQPAPTKINTTFNEPTTLAASTPVETKEPSAVATPPVSNKQQEPSAVATELASNKESSQTMLSAPNSAYTVQLIAMKNLNPVLAYAKQVGIDEPLITTVLDEGQVWHLLLLGIYEDSQSASTAKDSWIGTRILKVEPWIRKLAPLQEAIERYLSEH